MQSKTGQGEVFPFYVHFVVGCKVLHASWVFFEVCVQLALSDKMKLQVYSSLNNYVTNMLAH